jgi:hypothetical protein
MKKLFIVPVVLCVGSVAAWAQSGSTPSVDLSLDQQQKVSEMVTNATPRPKTNVAFPLSIGTVVPPNVTLHRLPADAEKLAPKLRGDSYVAVEEMVAIVDTNSRKIIAVIQRVRRQEPTRSGG